MDKNIYVDKLVTALLGEQYKPISLLLRMDIEKIIDEIASDANVDSDSELQEKIDELEDILAEVSSDLDDALEDEDWEIVDAARDKCYY